MAPHGRTGHGVVRRLGKRLLGRFGPEMAERSPLRPGRGRGMAPPREGVCGNPGNPQARTGTAVRLGRNEGDLRRGGQRRFRLRSRGGLSRRLHDLHRHLGDGPRHYRVNGSRSDRAAPFLQFRPSRPVLLHGVHARRGRLTELVPGRRRQGPHVGRHREGRRRDPPRGGGHALASLPQRRAHPPQKPQRQGGALRPVLHERQASCLPGGHGRPLP